jgi:hypothetical protein
VAGWNIWMYRADDSRKIIVPNTQQLLYIVMEAYSERFFHDLEDKLGGISVEG